MILKGSLYWLHNKFQTNRCPGYSSFSVCDVIKYLPSPDERRKYSLQCARTRPSDLIYIGFVMINLGQPALEYFISVEIRLIKTVKCMEKKFPFMEF